MNMWCNPGRSVGVFSFPQVYHKKYIFAPLLFNKFVLIKREAKSQWV